MKMMRCVGIPLVMLLLSAPLVRGQDLSKYRDFSLGMSLPKLSSQVDLTPLQTKLIQKHPPVIQELTCWPGGYSDLFAPNRLGLADFLQLLQWRALQDFGDL